MEEKKCLLCQTTENKTILVTMNFKGKEIHMCPSHLPILIHDPQKLVGIIEGAENFIAG